MRLLCATIVLGSVLSFCQEPERGEGWWKLKWGMTIEEVQKAYPDSKKHRIDIIHTRWDVDFSGPFAASSFPLAGQTFQVTPLYNEKRQLAGTHLRMMLPPKVDRGEHAEKWRRELAMVRCGQELRRRLAVKYGRPVDDQTDTDDNERITVWARGGTEIRFRVWDRSESGRGVLVSIAYLQVPKSELSKL